jgi:hypothetical protein
VTTGSGWCNLSREDKEVAKLQIELDEQTLQQASTRAKQEGTTVKAVVIDFLSHYSAKARAKASMAEVVKLARQSTCGSDGRRWTREELYER